MQGSWKLLDRFHSVGDFGDLWYPFCLAWSGALFLDRVSAEIVGIVEISDCGLGEETLHVRLRHLSLHSSRPFLMRREIHVMHIAFQITRPNYTPSPVLAVSFRQSDSQMQGLES